MGKRTLIHGAGIAKKPGNEVAGAHVMRQVAKELFAEGIVTHVLDGGTAVRRGMGLAQLRLGCARETRQQQRLYGIVPCQVNQFFIGKNGIGGGHWSFIAVPRRLSWTFGGHQSCDCSRISQAKE